MNKNKTLLIVILAFVLLLGGAYVLYDRLSQDAAPEQLAVQSSAPTEQSAAQSNAPTEQPGEEDGGAQEESEETEAALAPDFTVYDRKGNAVRLHDYIGKPIVLNFWASWCGPCQIEMPDFDEAYAELGGDIHFLMVNMTDGSRETVETASEFISEQGYSFPVFYDTESDAAATYGVYSLPTTFFIDAEGYGIAQAIGAINRETLQKGIDMILPE